MTVFSALNCPGAPDEKAVGHRCLGLFLDTWFGCTDPCVSSHTGTTRFGDCSFGVNFAVGECPALFFVKTGLVSWGPCTSGQLSKFSLSISAKMSSVGILAGMV